MIGNGRTAILSMLDRSGSYHRATIVLNDMLSFYQISVSDADDGTLTDTILSNGLILWINQKGDLGVSAGGEYPLGPAASGRLISGPSGVFCVIDKKTYRLSLSA